MPKQSRKFAKKIKKKLKENKNIVVEKKPEKLKPQIQTTKQEFLDIYSQFEHHNIEQLMQTKAKLKEKPLEEIATQFTIKEENAEISNSYTQSNVYKQNKYEKMKILGDPSKYSETGEELSQYSTKQPIFNPASSEDGTDIEDKYNTSKKKDIYY